MSFAWASMKCEDSFQPSTNLDFWRIYGPLGPFEKDAGYWSIFLKRSSNRWLVAEAVAVAVAAAAVVAVVVVVVGLLV